MKALLNSLLVAFTLTLISFSVSQAEVNKPIGNPKNVASFKSSIYTSVEGKVKIALHKQTGGTVVIRLANQSGTEIFAQKIGKRQQAARLSLDVNALPDGVYQVTITNGVETTTQELTLATRRPSQPARLVAIN